MPYIHPLHTSLLRGGWGSVSALIGHQESALLDFKLKSDPSKGDLEPNDRRILVKVVTALANSGGGLVVLGVDARLNKKTDIDEVVSISPIANIGKFCSDVNNDVANLASPILEDVTVDVVENPHLAGSGVLLVSVGRSERRPHMCEIGDRGYFKRSGCSSRRMEHFDIEDAFHRTSVARLELRQPSWRFAGTGGNFEDWYLDFPLKNVSAFSARFPYVQIEKLEGGKLFEFGIDGNRNFHLNPVPGTQMKAFAGTADTFIHPDQELIVFSLVFHLDRPNRRINRTLTFVGANAPFDDVNSVSVDLVVRVACENSPLRTTSIHLSSDDLQRALGLTTTVSLSP